MTFAAQLGARTHAFTLDAESSDLLLVLLLPKDRRGTSRTTVRRDRTEGAARVRWFAST